MCGSLAAVVTPIRVQAERAKAHAENETRRAPKQRGVSLDRPTGHPWSSSKAPAAFIARIAKGDLETGSVTYLSIFAVGLLLFSLTLAMNLLGYRLSRNLRARNRT